MISDPIVEEVRAVRERLAAELNYDLAAIFNKLRADQRVHGDRLIRREVAKSILTVPKPQESTV